MRILTILFFISFNFYDCAAQAGMNVYAGPSAMFSKDEIVTPSGNAHFGYVLGAHARLNSDAMYFLLSAEYGAFDLIGNKKYSFIGGKDLTYLKTKIGLGFDFLKLSKNTHLRTKLQGSILFVNSYDVNELAMNTVLAQNGYIKINDGIGGLTTSFGISKGAITMDLEYEYGFFNLYSFKKSSTLDFINLIVGFRF